MGLGNVRPSNGVSCIEGSLRQMNLFCLGLSLIIIDYFIFSLVLFDNFLAFVESKKESNKWLVLARILQVEPYQKATIRLLTEA